MSTGRQRTKSTSVTQASAYLSKSEEYLAAAERELRERLYIAATSLAIHAGINAADAVCGIRLGRRAVGQNHKEVLDLLDSAGSDGKELAPVESAVVLAFMSGSRILGSPFNSSVGTSKMSDGPGATLTETCDTPAGNDARRWQ